MYTCKDCGQQFPKLYAPKKQQCRKCYKREWERNAWKDPVLREKLRQRKKRVYERTRDKALQRMKRYREQKNFDSKRQQVLEMYNYTCSKCNQTYEEKDLTVHHKDRNGRGSESPNNDIMNLELLCRACHCEEHAIELAKARGVAVKEGVRYEWALSYPACVKCGTTERRHTAHGLCVNCYKRERNKLRKQEEKKI